MSAINFNFENEKQEQEIHKIPIELVSKSGKKKTFEIEVDVLDGTCYTRYLEVMEIVRDKEKYIKTDSITEADNMKALEVLFKVRDCIDYVYNLKVCDELYQYADPFAKVGGVPFSQALMIEIQKQINLINQQKQLENSKNAMREFVNKNA